MHWSTPIHGVQHSQQINGYRCTVEDFGLFATLYMWKPKAISPHKARFETVYAAKEAGTKWLAALRRPRYVCDLCGFEDTKELRDGINNHWRKGYREGIRPSSQEGICYGHTKLDPR
jgi:hypothetical protein